MKIPLDRLEEVVDKRILKRGQDYLDSGAVQEPEELEQDLYEAIVEGSEDYTVQVRLKDNIVTEYQCDCPYDLGPVCKHVVALILELQDTARLRATPTKSERSAKKKPTLAEQIDGALSTLPHNELADFVRKRCMADPLFRQQFLIGCAPHAIAEGRQDHLKRIRSGLKAVGDRSGYIEWKSASAAADILNEVLEQALALIRKDHPQRALPMIAAVIEGGAEAIGNADDSNGHIGGAITSAMEALAELAKAPRDEAFRKELLTEVQRMLADRSIHDCDWDGNLEPAAATLIRTEAEAGPLMAALKRPAADEYGGSTARSTLLDLTRRFKGDAAATALEEEYMAHTDVRTRAIEAAIAAKDWPRARQLAEAGRHVLRNGRTTTHEHYWTPYLLRIAQLTKDIPEVVRLARVLLVNDDRDSMAHLELLRKHVPASEWKPFVDQLLKDLHKGRSRSLIASIAAKEGHWDEVMAIAHSQSRHPHAFQNVLDEYEKELAKRYKDEVTTILAERAEAFASKDGPKNSDYVEAVTFLRRVRKLGDPQLADALAADWRVRLARRKGLMAELDKL